MPGERTAEMVGHVLSKSPAITFEHVLNLTAETMAYPCSTSREVTMMWTSGRLPCT